MIVSVILNLLTWIICYSFDGAFLLGDFNAFVITIFNVCVFIIKKCIFDKAISKDDRHITIYWLCNMTFGEKTSKKKRKNH
jgi:hypothetical protein